GDGTLEAKAPAFMVSSDYYYEYYDDEDYSNPVFTGHVNKLKLRDESVKAYPEFASSFESYMEEATTEATATTQDYIKTARADREESIKAGEDYFYTGILEQDYLITRADEVCVSILSQRTTDLGGAHGYTEYTSRNFDTATGQELEISDVIADRETLVDVLTESLIEAYSEDAFYASSEEGGLKAELKKFADCVYDPENFTEDKAIYSFEWDFTADGVEVIFNAYAIAPYASGTIKALVPYGSGLIDEKFVPGEDNSIITQMPLYTTIQVDTNGDGEIEKYECWASQDVENIDDYCALTVFCDDQTVEVEDYFFSYEQYMAVAEGKHFLIVDTSGYDDWHNIYCFELSDGHIYQKKVFDVASTGGYYDAENEIYYGNCLTDSSQMLLAKRFDILSTYNGYKSYKLNSNGAIESEDEYYTVDASFTLKFKQDFEAETVDENGEVTGNITVYSGTGFKIIRTDGETIVDGVIDDGTIVRLHPEHSEDAIYSYTINGLSVDELFDDLFYAG
ncbi:MAG: RsiV family protein, partial [Butyrivibrio sp.]|nr:RsiV family protein [Butyrivibrio sp.]